MSLRLIIAEPLTTVEYTQFAVLVGLVYGFLPFMVLPIYASVERFDFKFVDASLMTSARMMYAHSCV